MTYNFEPLRVRARLRTGAVCDKFMPLDGILLYQVHRWHYGAQVSTIPGGSVISENRTMSLPFKCANVGRHDWYYLCSWAQWSHEAEGKDYWNKRFDNAFASLIDFGGRRGNVIIGSGDYKAYHMPVFYRVSEMVEWYCVGDKAAVEALLSTVTNIGKKTAQGWGRVALWEVEKWAEDWSVWNGGRLMRGIPAKEAQPGMPYNIGVYGIRPSYWRRSNQMPLMMPL